MRPIPKHRHLVAVMIFAAVAAGQGYMASLDDRLSDSQVNIASAAGKRHDPSSFAHDPVFGESKLWLFHTPAIHGLLELMLVPTQYQDLRLGFRALAGVVTMLYLCGMYALLFAQCRSWSVSAFVSVLSCRVIEALGGGVWGVGSLESITPQGMCTAVFPLIVMAFARYSRPPGGDRSRSAQWRLLLVFAVVGVMGNFHLATAMNATIVLLIAYMGRQRFSPRCWPTALGCGIAALLGALPYAGYYFGIRAMMGPSDPAALSELVRDGTLAEAFRIGELMVLYPDLLKSALDWKMLAAAMVLIVPAVAVLGRVERFRTPNVGLWVWLVVGSLAVALGLHGLSQAVGRWLDRGPPVIDFLRASSLLLLPLYVLLAQAITNVFRLLRSHRGRGLARWACAAVLVAWILPSDNVRVARHAAAALVTSFIDEADRPTYVLRHAEQRAERRKLAAIGRWAAEREGAVFLTDRGEFRVLARQSILVGPNDARYLYYLAPSRLGKWLERFRAQQQLLHPSAATADAAAIKHFVDELIEAEPDMADVAEWYVILGSTVAPEEPGPLTAVQDEAWGGHYRLYSIR